jgi:hypothetical protein
MSTAEINIDPTVPAPMTNVAEYAFEGRFAEWADDAKYFEYSKAANPIGSGLTPKVPIRQFGPELYRDQPTGLIPLDLSGDLGTTTGEATSPGLLASFIRIRAGEQIDTHPNATSQLYYAIYGRGFAAVTAHWCGGRKATSSRCPPDPMRCSTPTTTRHCTGCTTSRC